MVSRKLIQFSDLNVDVIFEIFLVFVAIDWDGPFTLMLVCTNWMHLVLSKPRLWTWIKIDDTQTDWKERVDVAAYLSRTLPLQICLRTPFTSTNSMKYITDRCKTVIVESDLFKYSDWAKRRPFVSKTSRFRTELNQIEKLSLRTFLKEAPKKRIKILYPDGYRPCAHYPMWTVYDDYIAGKMPSTTMKAVFPYSLTTIVFSTERDGRSAVPLQLSQLWEILPCISRLGSLKLSNTMIDSSKSVALPSLFLPFLQNIELHSPMSHRVLFSFEEDTWLGLFSILKCMSAPIIGRMVLRGSVHRIVAAMMGATILICPLDLVVDILSFDEATDTPAPELNPAWYKLGRLTIRLPDSKRIFSRVSLEESTVAARFLLFFVPRTCSIRVYAGDMKVAPLGLRHEPQYDLRSLAIAIAYSCGFILFRTGGLSEGVAVENQKLVIKSLDIWDELLDNSNDNSLEHLVDLRCALWRLQELIAVYTLKSLRTLTLFDEEDGNEDEGFDDLVSLLMGNAVSFPHLTTISIEFVCGWRLLIELLGNFGKSEGRGISMLNLPGLPHPSIIREIISALNSGREGYTPEYVDRNRDEFKAGNTSGCWQCFKSGWTCFEPEGECTRFTGNILVSITKDSTWTDIDG